MIRTSAGRRMRFDPFCRMEADPKVIALLAITVVDWISIMLRKSGVILS